MLLVATGFAVATNLRQTHTLPKPSKDELNGGGNRPFMHFEGDVMSVATARLKGFGIMPSERVARWRRYRALEGLCNFWHSF